MLTAKLALQGNPKEKETNHEKDRVMSAVALLMQALIAFYGTGFTADPCPREDSVPTVRACYWDADARGNGDGESFIVFPGGTTFRTVYAP